MSKEINGKFMSGKWPSYYEYLVKNNKLIVRLEKGITKNSMKGIDVWALAAYEYLKTEKHTVSTLEIVINNKTNKVEQEIEALKRRISFLNINNIDLNISLVINSKTEALYDEKSLFNRDENEIIHPDYKQRDSKDRSTGLEKLLQNYLFDTMKQNSKIRTNERLAIFGEDFFNLKKKQLPVTREFPTGAFERTVTEKNRLLPTEYIDIITTNKYNELSIIELKLNDVKLDVVSQALNYILFCASYKIQLQTYLRKYFNIEFNNKNKIICYIISNRLHPRFDSIMKYYVVRIDSFLFTIKPTILGYYIPNEG